MDERRLTGRPKDPTSAPIPGQSATWRTHPGPLSHAEGSADLLGVRLGVYVSLCSVVLGVYVSVCYLGM